MLCVRRADHEARAAGVGWRRTSAAHHLRGGGAEERKKKGGREIIDERDTIAYHILAHYVGDKTTRYEEEGVLVQWRHTGTQ